MLLHHYMGDIDGGIGAWGFARGGIGAISNALGEAVEDAGDTIHTGAGVDQILIKHGRVTGVPLEDGTEFLTHVDRAALPKAFTRAVERFKIRGSSAKLNIALDRMPDFPAAPDHASFLRGERFKPAQGALVYHRKKREVGHITSGIWSPRAKRNIASAHVKMPCAAKRPSDLWAENYTLEEGRWDTRMAQLTPVKTAIFAPPRTRATRPARP